MTLTSDFGGGSPYVTAIKAALLGSCPAARLLDVGHDVPPFDVRTGGFLLWAGSRGCPAGSVHVAVVDPGVGGRRRALALRVDGSFYVGPDNGIFWMVESDARDLLAVELERPAEASPTFEGRDVFAPAAGRLASGFPIEELGLPVTDLLRLPDLGSAVIWVDRFGNLVTNLRPPVRSLRVGSHLVEAAARTYAEAPVGEPFLYVGSLGLVEVGVREGRADLALGAAAGTRVIALP